MPNTKAIMITTMTIVCTYSGQAIKISAIRTIRYISVNPFLTYDICTCSANNDRKIRRIV